MTKVIAVSDTGIGSAGMVLGPFTFGATGMTVVGRPSFEAWQQCAVPLRQVEAGVQWWIGDWLNFGKRAYGEKYRQAMEVFGLKLQTLANYASVSKAFKKTSRRREVVTWSKHASVAGLKTEKEQDRLLSITVKEKLTDAQVRKAVRRVKRGKTRDPGPLPDGTYSLILADPPWRYEHAETDDRSIEKEYPTMALEAICALPIGEQLAAPNCVLYLWTTPPKLGEAFQVLAAWGFSYRTCMVWIKPHVGMGYWARQRHELVLIAVRGKPQPPLESERPDSVFEAPRGRHSEKPAHLRELLERLYPKAGPGPSKRRTGRVELFTRQHRPGWDGWGNQ